MPIKPVIKILLLLLSVELFAQTPTVGLISSLPGATDVYTLFAPAASTNVYLINNCGQIVNSWNTNGLPGQAIAITNTGDLVHTAKIENEKFSGGGALGGRIEMFSWAGELKWRYNYSSPQHTTHHDMCLMPNGNILLLAWELKTPQQALAAGRKPDYVPGTGMWTEQIIELKPIGTDSAVIVWKWDVWDHLIQDYDSTKPAYGVIANHPEKVDFNFDKWDYPCWVHFNSLDYNAELNQIMVSSRVFGEIWIINHDTEQGIESKSDLLFRYGNPATYGKGTEKDLTLFYQHDARWVKCGTKFDDAFMVFNNGTSRPVGEYSTIETILPEKNSSTSYTINSKGRYSYSNLYTYNDSNNKGNFFSRRVSSVDLLKNGHMRVCIGTEGRFIEIDENENIVWQYICPIGLGGIPVSQGSRTPAVINTVFKTTILYPNHPALVGKDLSPKGYVETNPRATDCNPHNEELSEVRLTNKSSSSFIVEIPDNSGNSSIHVLDTRGNTVVSVITSVNNQYVDLGKLVDGVYIITVTDKEGRQMRKRYIKLTR